MKLLDIPKNELFQGYLGQCWLRLGQTSLEATQKAHRVGMSRRREV